MDLIIWNNGHRTYPKLITHNTVQVQLQYWKSAILTSDEFVQYLCQQNFRERQFPFAPTPILRPLYRTGTVAALAPLLDYNVQIKMGQETEVSATTKLIVPFKCGRCPRLTNTL